MGDGTLWCLTGFYGSPKASNRVDSWELFRQLKGLWGVPWCAMVTLTKLCVIWRKWEDLPIFLLAILNFSLALDDCNPVDLGYR